MLLEGTYGDRVHAQEGDKTEVLCRIIGETFSRGGNLSFPPLRWGVLRRFYIISPRSFGRSVCHSSPTFLFISTAPWALKPLSSTAKTPDGYYDEEALALIKNGQDPLVFDSLHVAKSVEESKLINEDKAPKVILSASGMCDAGRIRHHLKHNLWRQECTVLFVGYQAVGTVGRMLLDGAKKVKLFGEEISVAARIERIEGLFRPRGRGRACRVDAGL